MVLTGKRAVVTGGSRGIGAEICRVLASDGAQVIVNYHSSAQEAEALVQDINERTDRILAFAVKADVGTQQGAESLINAAVELMGRVDILINNAGTESTVSAIDLPMEEWDRVMNVNLRGAFICAQAAARQMIAQGSGGVILNNSSIHETVSRLGLTHYCVSKAGLRMMSKALALEWVEHGIRVLGVAPGAIETDANRAEIASFGVERFEEWIPAARLGQTRDVADAVRFLVSDQAGYITGTTIEIDGGYILNLVRYDPRKGDV